MSYLYKDIQVHYNVNDHYQIEFNLIQYVKFCKILIFLVIETCIIAHSDAPAFILTLLMVSKFGISTVVSDNYEPLSD